MIDNQFKNKLDEKVLWNAIRNGNHKSFRLIYMEYSDFLYNYGRKMCQDSDLVRDSIQDVFRIIWEKKEIIVIKSSLKHYVFTIFRRELIQKIQHQQNLTDQFTEIDFELSIESKIILDESQQHLRKNLDQAINKLSLRQKEIIFLRYYENMSYSEIAELMSLNQNSMYKLLSAAISRIKDHFSSLLLVMYIFRDISSYLF